MNREDIIRMYAKANGWSPAAFTDTLEELKRFAELVASAEREVWEHKYARLQSLMDIRETQPNKPCCLAEREKYEAIITNMTKLLEAQQNREGVAVDMIAAGIAAEREACIDLVAMYGGPVDLEAAIRARGQA